MAIEIDWLGGNCPVQAVGKIDGEPFYCSTSAPMGQIEEFA